MSLNTLTGPGTEAVEHDPFAGPALEAFVPISESQREVWLAAQLGDDVNLAYNEGLEITLRGTLDEAALKGALQQVIDRHEGLRASFSSSGDWMMVLAALPLEQVYTTHDFSISPDPLTALATLDRQQMHTPFDVEQGPLLRFHLVKLAADDHRLLFIAHHVICDGWSGAVVITEIGALYSAAVEQTAAKLKPPVRYGDYAIIDQQFRQSEEGRKHEQFWLDKLKQTPANLDLPADRMRPTQRSFGAGRIDHRLNAELVANLRRTGAAQGASLVTLMLAGFAALLHRLTGSEDMVIGLSSAGQSFHQVGQLVGHCVNKLPLRLKPQRDARFSDFLRAARSEVLDAFDHQGVTYGSLLPKLHLARDESRPPLISITFNIDVRDDDIRHTGLQVGYRTMVRKSDSQELYINVVDNGEDLVLEACYNAELFDADTIRRRVGEYETLLTDVCRAPDAALAALNILGASEKAQLAAFNATKRDEFVDGSAAGLIHEWVEQQALRTPDAVAVQSATGVLTYAQLNRRANQLAHWLRAQGVKADVPVACYVQRTSTALVALLGTLKAGGAYLPLDVEYPADRLRYMLDDARPPVLLSNFGDSGADTATGKAAEPARLAGEGRVHLDLVSGAALLDALPESAVGTDEQTPSSLAYVIYTSGSTGAPKGARLEHRGPLNQYQHYLGALEINPQSRFLVFSSLAFDLTQRNLWAPLMVGGRVVLVDSPNYDTDEIAGLIESQQITHVCCTPSAFYPLVESNDGAHFAKLASLRQVALGGESIQLQRLAAWRSNAHCQADLTNCYGPTEASANVAMFHVKHGTAVAGHSLPIGQAISNVQLHILDAGGNPLPLGVAGELHIGGCQLARDYLNRPELTAERFIPHPSLGRLYRTGDLCRRDRAGLLEYLGRIDNQVKLRGFRIELGEIEAQLARHAHVAEAFVDVVERSAGDARLVAWLVPGSESLPTASALRVHLRAHLPDYMLPQHFVEVAQFPLTPNGKLDRKALPSPFAQDTPTVAKISPRTMAEKAIAAIWAEVLGTGDIGIDDRFGDLGGHSMLAVRAAGQMQKAFGLKLPLRRVMMDPLSVLASAYSDAGATPRQDAKPAAATAPNPIAKSKPQEAASVNAADVILPKREMAPVKKGLFSKLLGG